MDATKVCSDLNELNPKTRLAVEYLQRACSAQGIPIKIFETYRPQNRQDYLYAQGRTRSGNIVTWTKSSQHTKRNAVDIIHPTKLWDMPDSYWRQLADIAKEIGFECGYFWTPQDKPHFQLNAGVEPRDITKGDDEVVTKSKIEINGTVKEVDVITKDGYNYIKLRDLADGKIKVDYDETRKIPIIKAE